jgi:hypothetical protein
VLFLAHRGDHIRRHRQRRADLGECNEREGTPAQIRRAPAKRRPPTYPAEVARNPSLRVDDAGVENRDRAARRSLALASRRGPAFAFARATVLGATLGAHEMRVTKSRGAVPTAKTRFWRRRA